MTKNRRTVSIEEEIDARLDEPGINASGLVNCLLKNHFSDGGRKDLLELRREQVQAELEELEARAESKREQLANIEEELEELRDERDERIAKADSNIPHTERVAASEMQLQHARTERDELKQQYEHAEQRVAELKARLTVARAQEESREVEQ